MTLLFEQLLNGLQFGTMIFLIAAGLTLVFGIMGVINLAHGSLYMIGAFVAATAAGRGAPFVAAVAAGAVAAGLAGIVMEVVVIRRLYRREHLDQVLATFALILIANDGVSMIWGKVPLPVDVPAALHGAVPLGGFAYPAYRLVLIAAGLLVALGLYLLISRTRLGMLIRAGATHRETVAALGVDIARLNTVVFGVGALLAGLAGALLAPIIAVQVGMGEQILILTFVAIVVGGLGSIRGAFVGALLVGLVDTLGRAYLPVVLKPVARPELADSLGGGLSAIAIYLLMAIVLVWKPRGLFPAGSR
ncbi:MAG TPA: branched-chain amino acid ABC transporter permease [Candidatus Elarobacter sp.]|jgi:branched-chain amino acid transport system permease protein